MGRAAKYTDQDILDAALEVVSEDGAHAATAVAIAKRLGAPSGSIYHRFASRDLILATLWVRTVKRFQKGFLEALSHQEPTVAARTAVAHTLGWSTTYRREAKVLAMYRREELLALWPNELGGELATLNDSVKRAVIAFTTAYFGEANAETLGKTRFALIEIPYAAVRHLLGAEQMPHWLEHTVIAASLAALNCQDPAA